jgi:putative peptide zinc metalloprotease protein
LFSPTALVLVTIAFFVAVVAMFLNMGQILGSDVLWNALQDPRTLLPVALALIVVKVMHELGHAFACRAVGRECNEMGVLFLAFMPCLYCNVSDVWMEPDRRKRMLVSAAGIYVEMLIAAACVPLCLFSVDGNLKLFWFTLMTICSVNTLLINGNPLLRYDGYYLLSDAAGVANLYSEAQRALGDRFAGLYRKTNRWQPISWLELYAAAAFVYRYFIVGVIVFTIYMFFVRMELPGFGLLLAMAIGAVTLAPTAYGSTMRLIRLREDRQFRKGRACWSLVILLLLLAGAMMIPIQTSTFAEGEVAFSGNRIVFAPVSGQISWQVQSGEMVSAGDVIGRVQSRDLQLKLAEQKLRVTAAAQTLKHLTLLQSQGIENTRDIELQKQVVAAARAIADSYDLQVQQATIVAEVEGMITDLPQPGGISLSAIDLRRQDSTLQDVNPNSFVSAGEPIAVIADNSSTVVRLNVPERSSKKVAIGQKVKLQVPLYSPNVLLGRVEGVAIDTPVLIERDAGKQEPNKKDGYVTVTVRLDGPQDALMYKANATAIVLGDRVLLWQAIVRFVNDNFSFAQ